MKTMKRIQTLFFGAFLCLAMPSANAVTGNHSGSLWYLSKTFSGYAPAKRLSPVLIRVNVISLLGLPQNVCSLAGQLLISNTYVHMSRQNQPVATFVPVLCFNNEQVPLEFQCEPGDIITVAGTVLGTSLQTTATKTVTIDDINLGVFSINLIL